MGIQSLNTVEIKEVSLIESFPLMRELMQLHWEESEEGALDAEFEIDEATYKILEDAGTVVFLLAWQNGIPIGYSSNILNYSIHYRGLKVATNEAIFIRKEYRNSNIGLKLITATKKACKTKEARYIFWHAKPESSLDRLLQIKKCQKQEIVYSEQL